tara:strand:- start:108 stop:509 length:402 start_codon:yes stop_codon:yes gene_type:complete
MVQQAIKSLFVWSDRDRVYQQVAEVPLLQLWAYVKLNQPSNIKIARLVTQSKFYLPEEFSKAALVYGIKPQQLKFKYPKKTKADIIPMGFSEKDKYWDEIIKYDKNVANQIRLENEKLPKKIKKKKEKINNWV